MGPTEFAVRNFLAYLECYYITDIDTMDSGEIDRLIADFLISGHNKVQPKEGH